MESASSVLGGVSVLRAADLNVGKARERRRQRRLARLAVVLSVVCGLAWWRGLTGGSLDRLGGNPRRGILFEGKPGTGKTHMAKAMARHAGVPFLFVSATSFQSMWYGMTARKIRAYFKALRKVARQEGGAIGFIEEIDAIGGRRGGGLDGGGDGPVSSGTGGV